METWPPQRPQKYAWAVNPCEGVLRTVYTRERDDKKNQLRGEKHKFSDNNWKTVAFQLDHQTTQQMNPTRGVRVRFCSQVHDVFIL